MKFKPREAKIKLFGLPLTETKVVIAGKYGTFTAMERMNIFGTSTVNHEK